MRDVAPVVGGILLISLNVHRRDNDRSDCKSGAVSVTLNRIDSCLLLHEATLK